VSGDNNLSSDLFIYDRTTKKIERMLINDSPFNENLSGSEVSFSEDARFMAFSSGLSNLVPGDNNGLVDVFVYDRISKLVDRVNISSLGVPANDNGFIPVVSADGRFVSFRSKATNLVPGVTNGMFHAFIFDRINRTLELASISDGGAPANNSIPSFGLAMSQDGRYVAFSSLASNLVPGDTNGQSDIFVYDRVAKKIERVSVSDAGVAGNGFSGAPSLSRDGRYVTFDSVSNNLVAGDNNPHGDVFVFDRSTKKINRVSATESGVADLGDSRSAFVSGDGRFVTYYSRATKIVPGDSFGGYDVFVYDVVLKKNEPITFRVPRSVVNVSQSTIA
jgi:Tol biopolymer transport system component